MSAPPAGKKHCFIVITDNPDVNNGNQQVYSLYPRWPLPYNYGVPTANDPRDTGPLDSGQTSCSDVPDCTSCKERQISQNAQNAGPVAEYLFTGPNSNSYVYYQLTHAGCTPPPIPNAPGYRNFPLPKPAPDQHGFGGPW